jgi:hypothetical protein
VERKRGGLLVCTGKLGLGKSTLLANVVEDLVLSSSQSTVAYFFCRHDIAESLKAKTVIGSLIRQLLQSSEKINSLLEEHERGSKLDMNALINFVLVSLPPDGTVSRYLVLDGIDECNPREREEILERIRPLSCNMPVCVSSRTVVPSSILASPAWRVPSLKSRWATPISPLSSRQN